MKSALALDTHVSECTSHRARGEELRTQRRSPFPLQGASEVL